MKEVKTKRSRSYREYLLSSLKDSQEAAAYIETFLELDEEGFDPKLLSSALKNVMDARSQVDDLSEEVKLRYEKLDKVLLERGTEIYSLVEFLDALGFQIAIALKD